MRERRKQQPPPLGDLVYLGNVLFHRLRHGVKADGEGGDLVPALYGYAALVVALRYGGGAALQGLQRLEHPEHRIGKYRGCEQGKA